jgi:large subunit ribosomal protein L11
MAKEVKARIKMQLPGGAATPAPPVGSALGQQQVNIMEFCKAFNAKTSDKKGQTIPVVVTVYTDKKFDFIVKTPPTTELIKKKLNLPKGSSNPLTQKVGVLSWKDVDEIAKIKLSDLNAVDIEAAKKIVAGTARSMGINVE